MKNLAGLMKQASQMQSKMADMQERVALMSADGSAGNGLVTLTLSGKGELRALHIDPKLADPADTETLQDLILAAHQDAKAKVEAMLQAEMSRVTGGLNLPPGLSLPF